MTLLPFPSAPLSRTSQLVGPAPNYPCHPKQSVDSDGLHRGLFRALVVRPFPGNTVQNQGPAAEMTTPAVGRCGTISGMVFHLEGPSSSWILAPVVDSHEGKVDAVRRIVEAAVRKDVWSCTRRRHQHHGNVTSIFMLHLYLNLPTVK